MHCPECAFANAEGANYCQKCGAFLSEAAAQEADTTAAYQLDETGELKPVDIEEVSYQRRILHGKIDILRAELVNRLRKKHEAGESAISGADVQQLTDILSGKAMPGDDTAG